MIVCMHPAIRGSDTQSQKLSRLLHLGPVTLLANLFVLCVSRCASPSAFLAAKAAEQSRKTIPSPWCEPTERLLLVVHGFCRRDWAEWNGCIDEDEGVAVARTRVEEALAR